jgi:hypothetical protein
LKIFPTWLNSKEMGWSYRSPKSRSVGGDTVEIRVKERVALLATGEAVKTDCAHE